MAVGKQTYAEALVGLGQSHTIYLKHSGNFDNPVTQLLAVRGASGKDAPLVHLEHPQISVGAECLRKGCFG
jgi:hypothetical protein